MEIRMEACGKCIGFDGRVLRFFRTRCYRPRSHATKSHATMCYSMVGKKTGDCRAGDTLRRESTDRCILVLGWRRGGCFRSTCLHRFSVLQVERLFLSSEEGLGMLGRFILAAC